MRYAYLFSCAVFFCCCHAPAPLLYQTAVKADLPEGAPKYSDVCFSSRWPHPRNPQDTLETFSAACSFHATYINWVYTTDPAFIRKADSLGYKLQVALTPTLPDLPLGSTSHQQGRLLNRQGLPVSAPWMKGWDYWWGCANNPEFQDI